MSDRNNDDFKLVYKRPRVEYGVFTKTQGQKTELGKKWKENRKAEAQYIKASRLHKKKFPLLTTSKAKERKEKVHSHFHV